MSTVQEIESAIEKLGEEELAEIAKRAGVGDIYNADPAEE